TTGEIERNLEPENMGPLASSRDRSVAAVAGPIEAARESGLQEVHSKRRRPRYTIALAGTLGLVSLGSILLWGRSSASSSKLPTLPLKAIPCTSYRGQQWDGAFSPDGNQIAFSWDEEKEDNWHIYVKPIGTEKPLRLTAGADIDRHPAWSPDGRNLA